MVDQDYDPVREALRAFAAHSPRDAFEATQRAAFRRALLGDLWAELDTEVPDDWAGDPLSGELMPLVEVLRSKDPQRVEDLFVILWNALLGMEQEKRHTEWVTTSEREVWTRHRLRQAWALQESAKSALEDLPERDRETEGAALVRIAEDAPVGDGWVANGTLSIARLAQGPPGSGRRAEAHDERRELMRFLVLTLGMPVQPATAAANRLLRIYLGLEIDPETLREWWNSQPRHVRSNPIVP